MQKISTLLSLCILCMAAKNAFAQRYFRMDGGKQINFHASGTRFIATGTRPITGSYNLAPGLTIDSARSLGKTGFSLLRVQPKGQFTARLLHQAGRQSGLFKYITPVLLTEKGQEIGALTDKIMVKLKDNTGVDAINGLLSAARATIEKKYEFDRNVYFIQLAPDSVNFACEIAWRFFQTGLFQYAEPDYLLFVKAATNDPFYNSQWALNNTGQNGWTVGADIKAEQAWGITTGCSNIRVAVVDNGVDLTHPDLQANLLPGFDATGGGTAGGADGDFSHGTNCAGIIGAIANNGIGITGIAPDCRIIPVRSIIGNGDPTDFATAGMLAAGIDWAWQNGADVISCSWHVFVGQAGITNAITNAVTLGRGGLGAVMCVATGNEDAGAIGFPASDPDVIAVGASSPCDQRKSEFPVSCDNDTRWGSNFGTGIDVVAPGVKIYTTDLQGSLGEDNSDYYPEFSGTSAATPHVAATIALLFSANPNLTGVQARQLLESTADKIGGYTYANEPGQPNGIWNSQVGYGRINAYNALMATTGIDGVASFCGNTTVSYTIRNAPANLDVTWTGTGGLQINSGQHTPTVSVTGVATGTQTLQASFSPFCALSKTVVVNGAPIIVGGYYNSNNAQVPMSTSAINNVCLVGRPTNMMTDMTILNNPTSVVWAGFPSGGLIWGQSGNNLALTFRALNQTGEFDITATNGCGTDTREYVFKSVSCFAAAAAPVSDYSIQLSPNPVSGMLRITTSSTTLEKTTTSGLVAGIRNVRIYDLAGRLVKEVEYMNMPQQVSVNTAGIYPGVYIVELFNGINKSRKTVIIKR